MADGAWSAFTGVIEVGRLDKRILTQEAASAIGKIVRTTCVSGWHLTVNRGRTETPCIDEVECEVPPAHAGGSDERGRQGGGLQQRSHRWWL